MKIPKGGFGVKVLIGCGIGVTSPHHRRLFFLELGVKNYDGLLL